MASVPLPLLFNDGDRLDWIPEVPLPGMVMSFYWDRFNPWNMFVVVGYDATVRAIKAIFPRMYFDADGHVTFGQDKMVDDSESDPILEATPFARYQVVDVATVYGADEFKYLVWASEDWAYHFDDEPASPALKRVCVRRKTCRDKALLVYALGKRPLGRDMATYVAKLVWSMREIYRG